MLRKASQMVPRCYTCSNWALSSASPIFSATTNTMYTNTHESKNSKKSSFTDWLIDTYICSTEALAWCHPLFLPHLIQCKQIGTSLKIAKTFSFTYSVINVTVSWSFKGIHVKSTMTVYFIWYTVSLFVFTVMGHACSIFAVGYFNMNWSRKRDFVIVLYQSVIMKTDNEINIVSSHAVVYCLVNWCWDFFLLQFRGKVIKQTTVKDLHKISICSGATIKSLIITFEIKPRNQTVKFSWIN